MPYLEQESMLQEPQAREVKPPETLAVIIIIPRVSNLMQLYRYVA